MNLGKIELQSTSVPIKVTNNLTEKGIKARYRGATKGSTRRGGQALIRGVCPGETLRFRAPGYDPTSIQVPESGEEIDIVLLADPATTAEYLIEMTAKGRYAAAWRLIHPDVNYATVADYRASVVQELRQGYQHTSRDAESFTMLRWVVPACDFANWGPKTYPRTAAVDSIEHWSTPSGGGDTDNIVTHYVQTKDGFWRWFPNVGCTFEAA